MPPHLLRSEIESARPSPSLRRIHDNEPAARGRQIGLFAPDGAHAEEAIAVAQFLRTRLGPSAVLQPRVVDAEARLPERAAEWEEVVR